MVAQMVFNTISHELYVGASNGMLSKVVKSLSKRYPQYASFIKARSTENILSESCMNFSFAKIDQVAKAFKANRAALGIKEPHSVLA